MKAKISLLLMICFFIAHFVSAQHNNEKSFVNIPPNPVASKFSLFTDNQPNLSTGSVNIPINLFGLSVYKLQIPIQLNYETSGINVMDTPLPYGHGWRLNINPRVTRHLLGRADEKYPFKNSYDPNNSNWGTKFPTSSGNYGDYYEPLKGIVNWQHNVTYQLSDQNLFDPQKDIFTIQLLDRSVNFYIDWVNGSPVARTFGNSLQIFVIVANKNIQGLKVVEEDGTIYRFGNVNGETGVNFQESYDGSTLTWLLREIELTNNQRISFEWIEKNISSSKPSISQAVSMSDWKLQDWGDGFNGEPTVDDLGGVINIAEYAPGVAKMLSKIDCPTGTIHLIYSATNEPLVTEINLKNKNGDILHKALLSYGERNQSQDHLLLQSIKVDNQKYSFSYNKNRFSNGSTSLDYWGFFNGKLQNSHIPKVNLKKFNNYYNYYSSPYEFAGQRVGVADKSVDTAKMKALILERITYPTGGYTIYTYEPHRFNFVESYSGFFEQPITPTSGGGLRVKKIQFYSIDNKLQIEKTYAYGKNEDGLANIKLVPTMNSFIDEKFQFFYNYSGDGWTKVFSCRNLSVKSLSDHSALDFGQSSFWYDQVTEYNGGGKVIRNFLFNDDTVSPLESTKLFQKRYTSSVNTLFQGGPKLSSEIIFKKTSNSYDTLSKKEYIYNYVSNSDYNVKNLLIDRRIIANNLGAYGPGTDVIYPANADFWPIRYSSSSGAYAEFAKDELKFNIGYYTIYPGFYRLEKELVTTYSQDGKITDETFFTYDIERPTYVMSSNKISSLSSNIKTTYRYVWNFSTSIAQLMVQKNMLNVPLEIEEIIGQSKTLQKNIFGNETAITTGLVLLKEKQVLKNSIVKQSSAVTKFDSFGNPLEIRQQYAPNVTYLWGYLGAHAVIKVENCTYAEVINALGSSASSILLELNKITVSDAYIKEVANNLRSHPNLSKALVSAFMYRPLIGLIKTVDVRGKEETYSYDSYGRLEYIMDFDGNIIKTFCYSIQGDLIDCRVFLNTVQSQTFQKNNCTVGQEGESILYTVPAGKYMSTISLDDANQKALADIKINGQNNANQNGSCIIPVVNVDVEISKLTNWNGNISRISFYKNGSSSQEFDIFPTNSGSSEYITIPEGEYSRVRIQVDGTGTPYNGMLSIVNTNATACQEIGMGSIELNFYNVKFLKNGNKQIVVAEYCMN